MKKLPENTIREIIREHDWEDYSFSEKKALVSALFSEIAYYHIPKYECDKSGRSKFISCFAHESLIEHGHSFSIKNIVRSAEFELIFTIETEMAIIVAIKVDGVIFIATRGTKTLNDLWVDIKALPRNVRILGNDYCFHRGFYTLGDSLLREIIHKRTELDDYIFNGNPIYFVGHSLGGALSAIMRTISEAHNLFHSTHSYTFAMPKYCTNTVLKDFRSPHSVINPKDIVPRLPPFYSHCEPSLIIEPVKDVIPLPIISRFQQHSMEHYLQSIERIVNVV